MTRINIYVLVLCLLSTTLSFAQSIDEERMERDLKIAENILGTLSGGENNFRLFNNIESNYIPDYGVVFSIPQSSYIYSGPSGTFVNVSGSNVGTTYVISEEDEDDEEDEGQKDGYSVTIKGKARSQKVKGKDDFDKRQESQKEQITTFLVDYADLIGQLKSTDRIAVKVQSRNDRIFIGGSNNNMKALGLTGQILKSDLIAYKQGKMDREDVITKVTFTSDEDMSFAKDVELFATIFARLYEPDLSSTYYISSRNIGYTKLEGFGLTFNMKVYSSSSSDGLHTIQTTGKGGLSQEERDEIVNAMYPEFEKTFKENLLDYGRTIKSLGDDEKIMFKVKLTECKGCEMPEMIEVSVSAKTLKAYDKGSVTRDNAIKQVAVKRN